jgi:hypothetical protein
MFLATVYLASLPDHLPFQELFDGIDSSKIYLFIKISPAKWLLCEVLIMCLQ